MSQRLPSRLESKISSFYSADTKFIKIGKYLFPLTGNMEKTPVFLDMVLEKSLVPTGLFQVPKRGI